MTKVVVVFVVQIAAVSLIVSIASEEEILSIKRKKTCVINFKYYVYNTICGWSGLCTGSIDRWMDQLGCFCWCSKSFVVNLLLIFIFVYLSQKIHIQMFTFSFCFDFRKLWSVEFWRRGIDGNTYRHVFRSSKSMISSNSSASDISYICF